MAGLILNAQSVEEYRRQELLIASRVVRHLPIIDACGWNGDPSGLLPYFDWRKDSDLFVALIEFHSEKSANRPSIRMEIIDAFYGGLENYKRVSPILLSGGRL